MESRGRRCYFPVAVPPFSLASNDSRSVLAVKGPLRFPHSNAGRLGGAQFSHTASPRYPRTRGRWARRLEGGPAEKELAAGAKVSLRPTARRNMRGGRLAGPLHGPPHLLVSLLSVELSDQLHPLRPHREPDVPFDRRNVIHGASVRSRSLSSPFLRPFPYRCGRLLPSCVRSPAPLPNALFPARHAPTAAGPPTLPESVPALPCVPEWPPPIPRRNSSPLGEYALSTWPPPKSYVFRFLP